MPTKIDYVNDTIKEKYINITRYLNSSFNFIIANPANPENMSRTMKLMCAGLCLLLMVCVSLAKPKMYLVETRDRHFGNEFQVEEAFNSQVWVKD